MQRLVDGARKILPEGYGLYLFGSRAAGGGADSDYDLGVDGPVPLPAGVMTRLEEMGDALPTLAKLDWVDLRRVQAGFREACLRGAVRLG
ncbi:MAG: nucleotidyltransferase domain-containing protein [Verrucomicrobia bacterium]|nr:nucleotidyltransferase domain-containing protein [Verrucomicrobiota bacterium]NBS62311.1 nucleotidyltransferase domain-containing protein [Microbacteriaceae bacterium]